MKRCTEYSVEYIDIYVMRAATRNQTQDMQNSFSLISTLYHLHPWTGSFHDLAAEKNKIRCERPSLLPATVAFVKPSRELGSSKAMGGNPQVFRRVQYHTVLQGNSQEGESLSGLHC